MGSAGRSDKQSGTKSDSRIVEESEGSRAKLSMRRGVPGGGGTQCQVVRAEVMPALGAPPVPLAPLGDWAQLHG